MSASSEGGPLAAGPDEQNGISATSFGDEPLDPYSYTQNRELSWLSFNQRVLEEALDETVPIYERLKFVAIFDSNLDEFFMVRVGSLTDMQAIDPDDRDSKSNMTAAEQLAAIHSAVRPLIDERDRIYAELAASMREYGIEEVDLDEMSKSERKFARTFFKEQLRPVLSPQVVDARHPFPFLRNKELYVVCPLTEDDGTTVTGIVGVPDDVKSYLRNPDAPLSYVRTEKIIAHNIQKLFDIYTCGEPAIVCVTRNADISFDEEKFADDEGDFRLHVSKLLKKRTRLAPVRMEVNGTLDGHVKKFLLDKLGLDESQVYETRAPINLQGVYAFEKNLGPSLRAEMCHPPFSPRASAEFDLKKRVIAQIEERDRILFYPYDSMDPFLRLLAEAAYDPTVVSVKITLYRVASDSRVAQHLIEAAENGKDVTVLMELRARFDEANNIDWSERLEEAGCNVIYGMENYKCHSKLCLVTRRRPDGTLVNITQVGTGNYNEKTARLYTDISLFTADPTIGRDAVTFFQNMLIGNLNGSYEKLLVAPVSIKRTIIEYIDREIAKGPDGRIVLKANSVTERGIIDKLVEASRAGVRVDMNIRGICCLVPGIEGVTDNIHVRSIVGQFLEHSRIYCFGTGDDLRVFISSADLMTRNLVHRVEVACPVDDERVRAAILVYLERIFADNAKARELTCEGDYVAVSDAGGSTGGSGGAARFVLHDWCVANALQPPLEKPGAGHPSRRAPGVRKPPAREPAPVPAPEKRGLLSRIFGRK